MDLSKVAAVTPKVVVADPVENTIRVKDAVVEAAANRSQSHCVPGALHYRIYLWRFIFTGDFY
ncbi:MAG: hypothetical protein ACLVH0_04215 [Coprococcus eutactus]